MWYFNIGGVTLIFALEISPHRCGRGSRRRNLRFGSFGRGSAEELERQRLDCSVLNGGADRHGRAHEGQPGYSGGRQVDSTA